ncbi:MAG: DMT family transporter [Candidatus Cloacimonetes bacterium]|nr:DMT family transporter [Candidatus Cloacimonadota bacterium]MCF7813265.1 DMT family transporter [Candidatus Cloacimonadota bacterium]MCF7867340.1 DMT family transporter [Candidatus Cloacimonadota bacterium]MCF7882774.1 DMT family transporter [Candidatus Cloacimonadota bacterium]
MTNQNKAYIFASFAVLFWSTAPSAFKLTLRYLNTIEMLLYSSFTASLALFLILIFQKKLNQFKQFSNKDFLHSAILGFLNPFFYYVILFKAYTLLPGQMAQPLNFVWPLMIVLLSIPILGQKIKPASILAIFISFCGVIIISTKGRFATMDMVNPLGVFLALSSSIIWALFFLINVRDKRDETLKLFLSFTFGFLFVLIVFLFQAKFPDFIGILGAIYIGLFEMGITFVIWVKALKLSQTTAQVNNLIYLTPFLALIFLNIFIKEEILFSTIIGLIFIVTGILIQRKVGGKIESNKSS